jgi:hypothetical protein
MPNMGPVVVGLGLHRRMRIDEMKHLAPFGATQHDPDDVVPTCTVDGIVGTVNRAVADAPYAIGVGVAELHQYAGLSGGHKAVSVGCGGRETIAALHHRDRILNRGVDLGRLDGNPFRAAVDGLGRAAGCRLALVYVPAVQRWLFGPPEQVMVQALAAMNPWWWVQSPAPGAVLVVPTSKMGSFYQASRAASYLALSPSPPLVEGATLVIVAHCEEGLGDEAGFRRALMTNHPPWQGLLGGAPPLGAGAQRAVILAMVAAKYKIQVQGCTNCAALNAVGIDAIPEIIPPPPTWLRVPYPMQRLPQLGQQPLTEPG